MRSVIVLAAAAFLLAGAALSSVASAHSSKHQLAATRGWTMPVYIQSTGRFGLRRVVVPMQAGANPTATPTSGDVTPTPTATSGPTQPDPVTILQNMYNVVGLLKTVHFEEIANQQGSEILNVDAVGDATCKGPAFKAHVAAKATLAGTAQSQKTDFFMIQFKKSLYWKSKSTKNTWQPAKAKQVQPFGFTVDNPLPCSSSSASTGGSSGGSTGGPTDTIRNLRNIGPENYGGQAVWHIQATDVQIDSTTNATSELPLDWYVGRDHSLLYGFVISFNDQAQNVHGSLTTKMSKFGVKVTLGKPKKGATKP